jgi:predicted alpha/beta superfamily hydrolase
VGAMSPSLWYAGGALLDYVRSVQGPARGRIYLDTGGREGGRPRLRDLVRFRRPERDPRVPAAQLHELLRRKGWADGVDLRYVEDPAGGHEEAAWRRRLPGALRFLLGPRGSGEGGD